MSSMLIECGNCGSKYPKEWFHSCPVELADIRRELEELRQQRDRLAGALREIAEGSPWGRRNAIWLAEQALASEKGCQP
jgi:hypothetical protein